jgi:hypothetical protein
VTLAEDPSNGDLTVLESFSEIGSAGWDPFTTFFQAIEALIRIARRCVILTFGHCLATSMSPPQIGTTFAANDSLKDALSKLAGGSRPPFVDDTEIAIIICEIILGMKFIHLRGVLHRDLKPANSLLDEHGCAMIGDLASNRFADLGLMLTRQAGPFLHGARNERPDGVFGSRRHLLIYTDSLRVSVRQVGLPADDHRQCPVQAGCHRSPCSSSKSDRPNCKGHYQEMLVSQSGGARHM